MAAAPVGLGAALVVVEPGPQLALLAAGQAARLLGLVGVPLDEGEGLQHRVVQVGGHVGALLAADALAPLVAELRAPAARIHGPNSSATPSAVASTAMPTCPIAANASLAARNVARPSDQQHRRRRRHATTPHPPRRTLDRVARAAAAAASRQRARSPSPARVRTRPMPTAAITAGHTSRSGKNGDRPPHQQQRADRDAPDGQRQLGVALPGLHRAVRRAVPRPVDRPRGGGGGAAGPRHARRRHRGACGRAAPAAPVGAVDGGASGRTSQADEVGDDADTVGQRQHDGRQADDDRVDAQPPRDARADTRHDVLVGAAQQPSGQPAHRGTGGGGHRLPAMMTPTHRNRLRDHLGDIPDCRDRTSA